MKEDVAGIESFIEEHAGDAAYLFAFRDRPLNGRGAAILRQQRSMKVDVAMFWESQHPRRNNASISDDDDCLRMNLFQQCAKLRVVLDFLRLLDWQIVALCGVLDWRSSEFESATLRAVWLRNY